MKNVRQRIGSAAVGLALISATLAPPALAEAKPDGGFNDEYIFAMTRGVNNLDMNPALKVTLYPVTVVLDTAFLPFAAIAGLV